MERTITLRVRTDKAPEYVPARYRRISDTIAEATVPYEEAERLFRLDVERRRSGLSGGVSWFVLHNQFTEAETARAEWFHVEVDRSRHQLASLDMESVPECPLCGIALATDLCPVVGNYKLEAPLALATDDVWLVKPSLAERLANAEWSGFALFPAFTSRKRRLAHLETLGLEENSTLATFGATTSALRRLALVDPTRAHDVDWWVVVPDALTASIDPSTPMGLDPAVDHPKDYPPPCGHLVAWRLLGPLRVDWLQEERGDLAMTTNGMGGRGGLFRPMRKRVVSRRLMEVMVGATDRTVTYQPIDESLFEAAGGRGDSSPA